MKFFPLFFFFFSFLIINSLQAQIDKNTQEIFDQFANQNDTEFNRFQDSINKKFTEELRKQWKQFSVFKGVANPMKPKPKTPIIADTTQKPAKPNLIPSQTTTPIQPLTPKPIPSPDTPPKDSQPLESLAPEQPEPKPLYPPNLFSIEITPFGEPLSIYSPIRSFQYSMQSISNEEVANVWENLSNKDFEPTIYGLKKAKENYNLNDWGTFVLVNLLSEKIILETPFHQSSIINVFILNQLGYDAKIAYNQDRLFCIVEVQQQLYGIQYVEVDSKIYYLLDGQKERPVTSIKTYQVNYSKDLQRFDFTITSPLQLKHNILFKSIPNSNKDQLQIPVNKNLINFYHNYPQMEISAYANSDVSKEFKESMVTYFQSKIRGKSEEEAVSFMLHFCQFEFDYANDMDQFGYEKPFFCEENFYYPKNDCEDRSIFFSFLIKEILNKEVLLLIYPDHIATAVHFENNRNGDYILWDEKRFYICDPTYINASIGMSMPQYINVSPEIIFLKSH